MSRPGTYFMCVLKMSFITLKTFTHTHTHKISRQGERVLTRQGSFGIDNIKTEREDKPHKWLFSFPPFETAGTGRRPCVMKACRDGWGLYLKCGVDRKCVSRNGIHIDEPRLIRLVDRLSDDAFYQRKSSGRGGLRRMTHRLYM